MTMSNAEIASLYRQAKTPLKEIGVLADLNTCSRNEIVEILRSEGCELPGNYSQKPKTAQGSGEDVWPDLQKLYGDPLFHERSRIAELASVIAAGDPAVWKDLQYMTYAAEELAARLYAIRDWKDHHIMVEEES